jgi:predicted DNA-binding protein with PD1-like motif
MKVFAFRLKPGSEAVIAKQNIKAGFIISCVGGLQKAVVRMAGAKPAKQDIRTFEQDYEIVSLVGTVSVNGMHMHISFSDREGSVIGGHLKEGTIVHPTAEIVIGIDETREFGREIDNETGFKELIIN